jgi:general secretion pathway protein A
MYEEFYGLTDQPFSITPDPRFLYLSESHKEGLAHLLYGVERKRGIVVLIGENGTGKTTLLNCLVQKLDKKTHIAYLADSKISPDDIYQFLLSKLGSNIRWNGKGEFLVKFENLLLEFSRLGENCVFIIDEAHHLSIDLLEQIRLLSNFETYKEKLIQILLAGTPELNDKINSKELVPLKQRIGVVYTVRALNRYETKCYIENRLFLCGASQFPFTQEAIEEVYKFSNGKPRMINIICDLALLFGFSEKQREIRRPLVIEAAASLSLNKPEEAVDRRWSQEQDDDKADAIVARQAWGGNTRPFAEPSTHRPKVSTREKKSGRWRMLRAIPIVIVVVLVYILAIEVLVERHIQRMFAVIPPEPPVPPSVDARAVTEEAIAVPQAAPTVPEEAFVVVPQPAAIVPASIPLEPPLPTPVETRAVAEEAIAVPPAAPTLHEEAFVAMFQPAAVVPAPGKAIQQVTALVHQFFPDGGAFALQVQPDKGRDAVYTAGEKLLVHIVAASAAYLQVDYYQADGQVVHLLPNALDPNYVEAGETFTLGKPESSFQFEISPPFGVEMLTVIASHQPLGAPGDVPSVEPASRYLARLAKNLAYYQAEEHVAVAYMRIRTQDLVDTR